MPLKTPVALAADQTLNEICRGSSGITVNATWSTGVPVVASVTVSVGSTLSTNFTAYLYRSISSESKYGDPVTSATVNGTLNSVKLTDTPPAGQYHYFVLATQPSGEKDCSEESATYDPAGGSSGINAVKAQEWFGNKSLGTLNLRRFEEQGKPPYTIVNGDRTVNRPKIRFQLTHIGAEGSGAEVPIVVPIIGGSALPIQWKNVDWYIFEAYDISAGDDEAGEKINDLYILADDNQAENVVFDKDRTGILKGKFTELTHDFDISNADLDKLFGYTSFHVPKAAGEWSCKNAGEAVYTVGPSGADKKHYSETGHSGDARFLNGNCIVPDSGWPQYWGVSVNSVPYNASKDGCVDIGAILRDGIGRAVVKIFACVVQNIIDGIYAPLSKATQDAGDQIGVLESNLAGTGPNKGFVDAWKFSLGLINIIVILALLAIAFANILHLNINTYTAKKALPGLVIGVVGANASLLLIRFVLDVAKALQLFAFDIASNPTAIPPTSIKTAGQFVAAFMDKIGMTAFENGAINFVLAAAFPLTFMVLLIFAIYMLFLTVVFAWGMVKRLVYIYGLTVLAPVAFVMYGVPGQQQWFTKWWDMMLRQIFMLPIVFIAAALLIRYVTVTVDPPNTTGSLDASNLINMVIIFLTATAILKLPGLITKGAVDIAGAAKKAFGMAKTTPQNVLGFTAEQMKNRASKYWTGKETASRAKIDSLKASGDRAGALAEARRLKNSRKNWRERAKSGGKSLDPWRKYATIVGNPEIFYAGYQDRMKQAATDRKVEFNSTKAEDVPFVPLNWAAQKLGLYAGGTGIRGIASGRKSEVNAGIDDVNDYIARGGDIQKLIDDVMIKKEGGDRPVWAAIKAGLSTGKISDKDILSLAGRTNKSSLQSSVLGLVNENGLAGHDSGWRSHGVMREVYEAVNKEVISRTRNTDLSLSDKNELTLKYLKEAISSNGSFTFREADIAGHVIPPGGSKATPVPSGAAASGGPNRPPDDDPPPPGGKPMKVFVTNPVQIQNPQNEAMFNKLAEHAQTLMETIGSKKLIAHAAASGGDVSKLLSGKVGEAINAQIGHLMNEGGGKLIHELVSAAANGGDVSALRALVARGEIIDRTGQEMASEAAQFSDDQINRLAETVGRSTSDAVQSIGGVIAPHLQKLGITDPKVIAAFGQQVINGIQTTINKDPKGLRASLMGQLGQLPKLIAREQGLLHIDNSSLARAIASKQDVPSAVPASQSPTSTTNINIEQSAVTNHPATSTPAAPATLPAEADVSDTPTDTEPSADS
ncbi:MAG: type IV secretion system protein [Candidatus Berkelbacteria bacterium]|nr:type IV secretion system protein [Candidatus Berkelbacteria bacterium]